MEQTWPELRMYMHLPTNTQIIRRRKKADQPEIRFAIKQDRNHLTTKSLCVCDAEHPKCPGRRPVKCGRKVGPCRFLLGLEQCVHICSAGATTPRKGDYWSTSWSRVHARAASASFVSRRISWKAHRAKRIGLSPCHYINPHADQALTKMDSALKIQGQADKQLG